jgi:hypothetical protein
VSRVLLGNLIDCEDFLMRQKSILRIKNASSAFNQSFWQVRNCAKNYNTSAFSLYYAIAALKLVTGLRIAMQ